MITTESFYYFTYERNNDIRHKRLKKSNNTRVYHFISQLSLEQWNILSLKILKLTFGQLNWTTLLLNPSAISSRRTDLPPLVLAWNFIRSRGPIYNPFPSPTFSLTLQIRFYIRSTLEIYKSPQHDSFR